MKKTISGFVFATLLVPSLLTTTINNVHATSYAENSKTVLSTHVTGNMQAENSINLTKGLSDTKFPQNNKRDIVDEIYKNMIANVVYNLAFDRNTEWPVNPVEPNGPYAEEFKEAGKWFTTIPKETIKMPFTDNDNTVKQLNAYYVKNPSNSNKTIIIAHGYRMNALQMGGWAKTYYDMGYNILLPDARAHGLSEGQSISFGWKEKADYKNWANKLVEMNPDVQIAITGVSMGGATTMMSSGEAMPDNVKAYIEDCGYDSVYGQFDSLKATAQDQINKYMEEHYNWTASDEDMNDIFQKVDKKLVKNQGFSLEEASSITQLHNNKKPMLFIHGAADKFVPTDMVYKNYDATQGLKNLWVVDGAGHGLSIVQDLPGYQQHVQSFLNEYIK
ncbi:alpha/beta hydrolase [Latilactobacillus sakei]